MEDQFSHFYMTLPSDSGMTVFPKNTLTDYQVPMDPPIIMNPEEWEVGLASASIPVSWNNILEEDNIFTMYKCWVNSTPSTKGTLKVLHWREKYNPIWESYAGRYDGLVISTPGLVPNHFNHIFTAGLYSNIYRFLRQINEVIERCMSHIEGYEKGKRLVFFDYNSSTRHVELHIDFFRYNHLPVSTLEKLLQELKSYAMVIEGKALLSMLGYSDEKANYFYFDTLLPNFFTETDHEKIIISPFTADIRAGYHHLYIYSNVAKAQRVGNVYAQFLDHVSMDGDTKSLINHRPNSIHYVPIAQGWFNTIHIYLRNELGEKIPFTSGKVLIKLHFRKRPLT